ncbi:MAG: hypothetical protein Q7R80_03710 [bacterium]|nr:hypothetical protein [bacterium]
MPKKKTKKMRSREALEHIQAAAAAGRIEFAPQRKIDALDEWVDRALEVLGHPEALVTDMSSVWDFLDFGLNTKTRRTALRKLSEKFGFPVKAEDSLVQVAVRLRDKAAQRTH